MTTRLQSKWNSDAEMAMQGFTIPIQSEEHLKHIIGYVLFTLKDMIDPNMDVDERTDEVFDNAVNKYNSTGQTVNFVTVSSSPFGVMVTFVRDKAPVTKRQGVLAWVENLEAPFCSELGYVYFQQTNGKIHRIA